MDDNNIWRVEIMEFFHDDSEMDEYKTDVNNDDEDDKD
jgi:hypothetical protein